MIQNRDGRSKHIAGLVFHISRYPWNISVRVSVETDSGSDSTPLRFAVLTIDSDSGQAGTDSNRLRLLKKKTPEPVPESVLRGLRVLRVRVRNLEFHL